MPPYMRWMIRGFLTVACLEILVLITGTRVLTSERRIEPGEHFEVPGFGNVGAAKQATLVCRYFNGRMVRPNVYWYSPNDMMGKSTCPVIQWAADS
jgi:hypothetical protein